MMFRTSPPFWQKLTITEPPGPPAYYCPLDNYREVDGLTPGFLFTAINGTGPISTGSNYDFEYIGYQDPPGPTKPGPAWKLKYGSTMPQTLVDLEVSIQDMFQVRANALYFELSGTCIVEIYDQNNVQRINQEISVSLNPTWNPHMFSLSFPNFISRVVFKQKPFWDRGCITNIKMFCHQPPAYAPFDAFASLQPFNFGSEFNLIEPSTYGNTYEAVDYNGDIIPAYFYPQTANGASEYESTWVLGRPGDAVKTLTVTVNNPSVTKYDTLSFEADGSVRIEIWDDLSDLNGPPTYQYDRVYNVPYTFNYWWRYNVYGLIHPPVGTDGNIKRFRLTARDPSNTNPLTLGSNIKPTNIARIKLGGANVVSKRVDTSAMYV